MARKRTKRQQRRTQEGSMPMGGAGLIRFAQEQSMGLKIGPIATIVASVVLIVVVIFAHKGYLDILF